MGSGLCFTQMKTLITFFLCSLLTVKAATITTNSLSRDAVYGAMLQASAGDTVFINATETNTWTTGISWTPPANVTLKFAGTTNTGGSDRSTIIDNIASSSAIIAVDTSAGGFRMTGVTFKSGSGSNKDAGTVYCSGAPFRVDHCSFIFPSSANYQAFTAYSDGVIDHSVFDLTGQNAIYVRNGGGVNGQGNEVWALPTRFGGTNFFFIEDSIFTGHAAGASYETRVCDSYSGARFVVRFNNLTSVCLYETHATGHDRDNRGPRAIEAYGNYCTSPLTSDPNLEAADLSSGCQLVWGNSCDISPAVFLPGCRT